MPNLARRIGGKKFMWDHGDYATKEEARVKMATYEERGFETACVEEDGKCLVYTRKLVIEIVIEGEGPIL